ncbi:MAG: FecR domain-containing protein [Myxococcota bacterium]
MSDYPFSRVSARLLAESVEEPRARGIDRDQGIAIVARAIAERSRRRVRARVLAIGGGLSAAAAIALVAGFLGARQATRGDASELACNGARPCGGPTLPSMHVGSVNGQPFAPGQSVAARAGDSNVIEFGKATQLALDASSELEYRQGDSLRRFGLTRGAVHLHVGKLGAGQRFIVETPDAEVEVRGTAFHVVLDDPKSGCASPRTSVAVDEGVVEVRFRGNSYRLTPGKHWPERCEQAAAQPAEPTAAAVGAPGSVEAPINMDAVDDVVEAVQPAPRAAKPPHHQVTSTAAKPAPSANEPTPQAEPQHRDSVAENGSALSEQNNLYGKAVAARRAGRLGEALFAYEQLLQRFPQGALAESARGERLRLLIRVDPERAKLEAARYLARYPRGLASTEARALLGQP